MSERTDHKWTDDAVEYLLALGRAGDSWRSVAENMGQMHSDTPRRRWHRYATPADKRKREENLRLDRGPPMAPCYDVRPAPVCQFPTPDIRFPELRFIDDPAAELPDCGRVPCRSVTWTPAVSASAWAVRR